MILAEGNRISAKYLPIRISEGGVMPVPIAEGHANGEIRLPSGGMSLHGVEKDLIRQALDQAAETRLMQRGCCTSPRYSSIQSQEI